MFSIMFFIENIRWKPVLQTNNKIISVKQYRIKPHFYVFLKLQSHSLLSMILLLCLCTSILFEKNKDRIRGCCCRGFNPGAEVLTGQDLICVKRQTPLTPLTEMWSDVLRCVMFANAVKSFKQQQLTQRYLIQSRSDILATLNYLQSIKKIIII